MRLKSDFVERSNLYKLDCHDFLQSLAMTVKNNLTILITRWLTLCARQSQRDAERRLTLVLATAMTCIFCHYEDEVRSNPKLNEFYTKWIASLHAMRLTATLAMTIKNNLVKSFLTSIKFTFDSLSRKIKNPCLVIKKFIPKGEF